MSQQINEDVKAFKAKVTDLEKRIVELDGENQKLRQTLDEASKTLKVYVDREKEPSEEVSNGGLRIPERFRLILKTLSPNFTLVKSTFLKFFQHPLN